MVQTIVRVKNVSFIRERERGGGGGGGGGGEQNSNSSSKTVFYKDCSLGSVKNPSNN